LLSGLFQGNLNNFLFSNLCAVVCFVLNIKVTLNDEVFYQSLSLAVGHSYEMVIVVTFQPHGCISAIKAGRGLYSVSTFYAVWKQLSL